MQRIVDNVFIGSYPNDEQDVMKLSYNQITGVLNLISNSEFSELYDKQQMLRIYDRAGIKFSKHLPIEGTNLMK